MGYLLDIFLFYFCFLFLLCFFCSLDFSYNFFIILFLLLSISLLCSYFLYASFFSLPTSLVFNLGNVLSAINLSVYFLISSFNIYILNILLQIFKHYQFLCELFSLKIFFSRNIACQSAADNFHFCAAC